MLLVTPLCSWLKRWLIYTVDPGKPLSAYGVDSLVAVEVRNWIAKEIQVELSVFDIMALVPMRQLAADLAAKSRLLSQGANL